MRGKIIVVFLTLIFGGCALVNFQPTLGTIKRTEWIDGKGSGYPLKQGVEIVRDKYGVPHIRAKNDKDLFFALGYAMAQDRFFQMDIFRRAGRGEICDLFGRIKIWKIDMLIMDKVFRALNYRDRAERGYADMPAEGKELLDAFTAGVNRYLADAGDTIPQYHFFKTKPGLWRPEDSLVCAELFGLSMSYGQLGTEYYYARILRAYGYEKAKYLLPTYPESAPVVVEDLPVVKANDGIENLLLSLKWVLNLGGAGLGSNNWVVGPEKSESGSAIISNDPHVPVYPFPTYWYLCHLDGGSFNIAGMMFPGLPAFGAAYNGDIAWALTNASIDHIDLFLEKVNAENPRQYLYKGEWKDFSIRKELISLRGQKPFEFSIRESIHGPVIDDTVLGQNLPITDPGQVFTLKTVDVELGKFFQGYLDMARAKNWEEFQAGLKNMSLGPVAWNHLFADKNGNIGYWLSGRVPRRADNQGYIIRKGWTGEQEWTGYIPFEELPHIYNPKQNYLATANNRNFPDNYPYYLGMEYFVERISRIDEVLRSKQKFSVADMEKLQLDTTVFFARTYVRIIIEDISGANDEKLELAVRILRDWEKQGFQARIDSIGASLYEEILNNLDALTFKDEFKRMYTGASLFSISMFAIPNIISDPDNPWFDNVDTSERETRRDIIRASTLKALKDLEKRFGKNPENWQWGKLSYSYFYTPMGILPGAKLHRIGKFPREGRSGTVNANEGISLGPLGHIFVVGPTTRMIVDFSDPGHFHFTATTGNSENIQSGRCGNLTENWVKGIYQTLSIQPEEYEKDAMGTLLLTP